MIPMRIAAADRRMGGEGNLGNRCLVFWCATCCPCFLCCQVCQYERAVAKANEYNLLTGEVAGMGAPSMPTMGGGEQKSGGGMWGAMNKMSNAMDGISNMADVAGALAGGEEEGIEEAEPVEEEPAED
jgi:hypothetical protein